MKSISLIIVLSFISILIYRAGGMSKELSAKPKWIPMFMRKTLWRDCGCSLVTCALCGFLLSWHWTLILCFWLLWGALTTYWKRTPNAKWYNWLMTGIGYSLAMLPYVIAEGLWVGFISRTIVLGTATMIWSEITSDAVWEECGRGALLTLTVPLLFI